MKFPAEQRILPCAMISLTGTSFGRVAHAKFRVALLARTHVGARIRVRDEVHVRAYRICRARTHEITPSERLEDTHTGFDPPLGTTSLVLQMSLVFMFTSPMELQNLQREVVSRTFGCNLSEVCLPELPRTGPLREGICSEGSMW